MWGIINQSFVGLKIYLWRSSGSCRCLCLSSHITIRLNKSTQCKYNKVSNARLLLLYLSGESLSSVLGLYCTFAMQSPCLLLLLRLSRLSSYIVHRVIHCECLECVGVDIKLTSLTHFRSEWEIDKLICHSAIVILQRDSFNLKIINNPLHTSQKAQVNF